MTDEQTPPVWVLIEAARRFGWADTLSVFALQNDYAVSVPYRALCDMILKHEQPPVDRKLLCAREAMAREAEATSTHKWATIFRSGEYDDTDHIRGPLRAIELWEEGFGK